MPRGHKNARGAHGGSGDPTGHCGEGWHGTAPRRHGIVHERGQRASNPTAMWRGKATGRATRAARACTSRVRPAGRCPAGPGPGGKAWLRAARITTHGARPPCRGCGRVRAGRWSPRPRLAATRRNLHRRVPGAIRTRRHPGRAKQGIAFWSRGPRRPPGRQQRTMPQRCSWISTIFFPFYVTSHQKVSCDTVFLVLQSY